MSESKANERQEGGNHYRKIPGEQHWDRATRLGFDFWQYMITKYVERCWEKNGLEDLRKAMHFIQKYIEVAEAAGRTGAKERAWLALEQTILAQGEEIKRLNESDAAEAARANADTIDWLMRNHIVTEDGRFTMPDGTVYECLRGKPQRTYYDFVHEGSYGDGTKLWTCTYCRTKIKTSGNEPPHKYHQPEACLDAKLEEGNVLQVQGAEAPQPWPERCTQCLFRGDTRAMGQPCADEACPLRRPARIAHHPV